MTHAHFTPRLTRAAVRMTVIFWTALAFADVSAAQAAQKGGGGSGSTGTPAQTAVYSACGIGWEGDGNHTCELYDVPAGQRLVIQHASLACESPSGYPVSQAFVGGKLAGTPWTPNSTFIPLVTQPLPIGYPGYRQTGSLQLTGYADPGSSVVVQAWGYTGANCWVTMTGYLVTMP